MMENDRNSGKYWQAGSYLPDSGGDEVVFQSPTTTPHYSVLISDWHTLEGEPRQLPVDPDALWLHSDLEDHQFSTLSSGPFESIENTIPSPNWELNSQFREVDLNWNLHASPESRKTFPVEGDDHVETAPGPENLGMCSRATQSPLPKGNPTTAENLKPRRNQNSKTGRRHRGPNWTLEENRSFLQLMKVQKGKPPWNAISDSLKAMGFDREAKACEDHWGVLLADLAKFQNHFGSDDILRDVHFWPRVGNMSREQRSQYKLPLVFEEEWFGAMVRIVQDRSKHRKSRREYSKDCRIHVAGTLSASSCRQQSRVSAAPAAASTTPLSEIFDNLVGEGDGINGLVKFLGSADRNVTIDQIIEVMRISLEAQKMDLRKQEIDWERERMYQGQRNELTEN